MIWAFYGNGYLWFDLIVFFFFFPSFLKQMSSDLNGNFSSVQLSSVWQFNLTEILTFRLTSKTPALHPIWISRWSQSRFLVGSNSLTFQSCFDCCRKGQVHRLAWLNWTTEVFIMKNFTERLNSQLHHECCN